MTETTEPEIPAATRALPAADSGESPWLGYLLAAIGAALFSMKAVIVKLAYAEGMNAETLIALRMALSLPVYAVIGFAAVAERRRAGRALPGRKLVLRATLVGMLGYWFASYADFLGLVYITAQFERLILFTYPAFVVILGALFFAQPVRRSAVVGIAVSYSGLAAIFATKFSSFGSDVARGAVLVLVSAIAFAFYQLLAKGLIVQIGPRLFTCIAMSGAAALALLQFALTQPLSNLAMSHQVLFYGILIAIVATVLPSFFLNAALQRISAQANATIGTVSPVITIALAVVVLGESLSLVDALGAALVIAGVACFTLMDRKTA